MLLKRSSMYAQADVHCSTDVLMYRMTSEGAVHKERGKEPFHQKTFKSLKREDFHSAKVARKKSSDAW